jgi:fucokinase
MPDGTRDSLAADHPADHPADDPVIRHSLQVAMEANAAAYRHAVQTGAPGECWDFVVLTAANEKQAQGYRQELELRHRAVGPTGAFFPELQRSLVVPDPPGRRAGSGGATLAVMRTLFDGQGVRPADFDRLRILLIHSGGASQRLPAYSPLGKIFAPLPLLRPDGQIATLFDHLYLTLAGLPDRLGPGMLVLAGDVFLLFDHRHVTAPPPGVTAISMRVDAELGRAHGVFVTDAGGRITATLQKAPVERMREAGAPDAAGRVLIDTGLLFFDAARTRLVAKMAGCRVGRALPAASQGLRESAGSARPTTTSPADGAAAPRGVQERYTDPIDLYEEITAALASGTSREQFLAEPSARRLRRELWRALHGLPFQVMELDGQFLHLGTTRQFRDAMVGKSDSPAAGLFQHNVLAHSDWEIPAGRRVYNSVLLADHASGRSTLTPSPGTPGEGRGEGLNLKSQISNLRSKTLTPTLSRSTGREGKNSGSLGPGSLVEHSILRAPSRVGEGSVVSQVVALSRPLELGDNLLLFQVPVRGSDGELAYVHVRCGVDDDFKGRYGDGRCTFLNRPIEQWLARHGASPDEVWPGVAPDRRTLWTARLFCATRKRDAAPRPGAWRELPRYSMAMMLEQADPAASIEHREVVSAHLQTQQLLGLIRARVDRPVDSVIGHYATSAAYRESEQLLGRWGGEPAIDADVAVDQARALWAAALLLRRPDHPDGPAARQRIEPHMRGAFAKVAEASEIGHRGITVEDAGGRGLPPPGVEVIATSPVRLDLAGGWSDTPPYCFERGGHVVNVAIDLDGRPPVTAIVRTLREPKLVLESHDLGQRVEPQRVGARSAVTDVRDPFALHTIALGLAGLLPAGGGDVSKHLKALGVGLHVVTESRVPKGSGLGTSSILGATLLAALHHLRGGRRPGVPQLIEQTLLLEQRLSTGGGWQDQVGGVAPAVKSTVTAPGIPQKPKVEVLDLTEAQVGGLEERLVVYYSGQQRLARDILRRVMGRWLAREPAVVLLQEQLKQGAAALRVALLKGRWAEAGRQIARYWQIKKELYPGSTTPAIDLLFLQTQADYLAAGLAGAGGGGFAYFLCRDGRQADRLRRCLAEHAARPGSLGSVYATQVNREGLRVTKRKARS